jgi:hypothetical protein
MKFWSWEFWAIICILICSCLINLGIGLKSGLRIGSHICKQKIVKDGYFEYENTIYSINKCKKLEDLITEGEEK